MNTQQYVGMNVNDATTAAIQSGFQVKIELDGPQALNNDFRPGRITLKVRNNIVTSANVG